MKKHLQVRHMLCCFFSVVTRDAYVMDIDYEGGHPGYNNTMNGKEELVTSIEVGILSILLTLFSQNIMKKEKSTFHEILVMFCNQFLSIYYSNFYLHNV